jgi:hypothetical protein
MDGWMVSGVGEGDLIGSDQIGPEEMTFDA